MPGWTMTVESLAWAAHEVPPDGGTPKDGGAANGDCGPLGRGEFHGAVAPVAGGENEGGGTTGDGVTDTGRLGTDATDPCGGMWGTMNPPSTSSADIELGIANNNSSSTGAQANGPAPPITSRGGGRSTSG